MSPLRTPQSAIGNPKSKIQNPKTAWPRLLRIQTAALTGLTPVYGALAAGGPMESLSLLKLFVIGLLVHICGFVLNEWADLPLDRRHPHLRGKPLVSGAVGPAAALGAAAAACAGAFLLTLLWFPGTPPLLLLLLAFLAGTAYDLAGKRYAGLDFTLAAWALFFCLYGGAVAGGSGPLLLPVAVLAALQILFNNAVEGGLKDAASDRASGVRSLALFMGVSTPHSAIQNPQSEIGIPRRFIGFAVAVKVLAVAVAVSAAAQAGGDPGLALALLIGLLVLYTAVAALSAAAEGVERGRLLRLFSVHEIATYLFFPFLVSFTIGPVAALLLLLVPVGWFVASNVLLYGKPLEPGV